MSQTIHYRGPPLLVGALAHLLREEGVEFKQPPDHRTGVAQVIEVELTVTAGDKVPDRRLESMIDAAVAKFKKRFGEDSTSVDIGDTNAARSSNPYPATSQWEPQRTGHGGPLEGVRSR